MKIRPFFLFACAYVVDRPHVVKCAFGDPKRIRNKDMPHKTQDKKMQDFKKHRIRFFLPRLVYGRYGHIHRYRGSNPHMQSGVSPEPSVGDTNDWILVLWSILNTLCPCFRSAASNLGQNTPKHRFFIQNEPWKQDPIVGISPTAIFSK